MGLTGDQDLDALYTTDAVRDILRLVRDGDDETAKIATSLICEIEELAVEEGLTSPVALLVSQLKFGDEAQKEQAAVTAMKLTKNQDLCAAIAHTDAVEALLALIEDRRGGDQSRFATTTMAHVVKCGGMTSSLETLSRLLELLEKEVKGESGSLEFDGVLETLAGLLLCANESIRCRAATLLCDLANQPSCVNPAKHIIDAGAVPALVDCIQDDSDLNWAKAIKLLELLAGEKEGVLHITSDRVLAEVVNLATKEQYKSVAIRILHKISFLKVHLEALRKAGATDLVIQVAQESSGEDGVVALKMLSNLVADSESLKNIVATGGIAMAMQKMKDGQGLQRQHALCLLGNLAIDDDIERIIGAMGAIPSIIEFLRSGTQGEKEDAAFSLFNLSIDPSNVDMIMAAGGLEALLDATHIENTDALKDALSVLSRLVTRNCDAKKMVVSTGGIPQIVKFLESKKRDVFAETMTLLKSLFRECDGNESQAKEKGVDALLDLCQDDQDTLKSPESVAIETFTENQELAQAIVSAGGVELLGNIAFAESSNYSTQAVDILLKLAAFPEHRAAIAASYRDRIPSANDA